MVIQLSFVIEFRTRRILAAFKNILSEITMLQNVYFKSFLYSPGMCPRR